jgi:hypothetical protein
VTWWAYLISTALISVPTVSVLAVGMDYSTRIRSELLGVLAGLGTVGAAIGTSVSLALFAMQVAA